MSIDAGYREGARSGDPQDCCPGCSTPGCRFASDFHRYGEHRIRACAACGRIFENGKDVGPFTVHEEEPG